MTTIDDDSRDAPLPDDDATRRLRLWLQMAKAVRAVEGRLRERLRGRFATTLPRFDLLATLRAAPQGLRMSELSRRLVVSNGNVTGVVDRLVADGLLQRETVASDRRAFRVKLTPAGRALADEMIDAHRLWVDEIFAEVDAQDCAAARLTMRSIRDRLGEADGSAGGGVRNDA